MQRKQAIIENGVEFWICPTCKGIFTSDGFYPSKRAWNGITSQCRKCHMKGSMETRDKENAKKLKRESMRRMRDTQPDKYKERDRAASKKRPKDMRYYARQLLNHALRKGVVSKPERCSKCQEIKKLTAHHNDYAKPLEVEWLCYECHGNR